MQRLEFYIIITLVLFSLSACGSGKKSSPPANPPPESTAEAINTLEPEVITIVSLRLDEIRMTSKAGDREISIDNVWMIPVSLGEVDNARFQYVEGDNDIIISQSNPYVPSSSWFISTERSSLEEQQFGMWFIVSGFDADQGDLRQEFMTFIDTAAPIAGSMLLGTVLFALPTPEEFIIAPAIIRGSPIFARAISGATRAFNTSRNSAARSSSNSAFEGFSEALIGASNTTSGMSYFGEVLIGFPSTENYYLNNQIIVPTTDGSLEIVFSIFETTNSIDIDKFTDQEPIDTYIEMASCNSDITSGADTHVIAESLNVMQEPSISSVDIAFRASQDDIILPLISYCQETNQTMWWLVYDETDQNGWIPEENQVGERVIEVVQ